MNDAASQVRVGTKALLKTEHRRERGRRLGRQLSGRQFRAQQIALKRPNLAAGVVASDLPANLFI